MTLVVKGEDKEGRKQLNQGSKNISFFFIFVNFSANMSYTPALGSKEVYTVRNTRGDVVVSNAMKIYPTSFTSRHYSRQKSQTWFEKQEQTYKFYIAELSI